MIATPEYPPTPQLDRIHAVKEQSQTIGRFLEWLGERDTPLELCQLSEGRGRNDDPLYAPVGIPIETLLAEYFDVDLQKADDERRSLLEWQAKKNKE